MFLVYYFTIHRNMLSVSPGIFVHRLKVNRCIFSFPPFFTPTSPRLYDTGPLLKFLTLSVLPELVYMSNLTMETQVTPLTSPPLPIEIPRIIAKNNLSYGKFRIFVVLG